MLPSGERPEWLGPKFNWASRSETSAVVNLAEKALGKGHRHAASDKGGQRAISDDAGGQASSRAV